MRQVILILVTVLAMAPSAVMADTRYISDDLQVTVRSGQGEQYRILKMLKAGTPVEVLQEDEATGYLLVRTPDGTEGWSLKRYINSETPKATIIARLEKERDRLKGQVQQLQEKQGTLQAELTGSRQEQAAGAATRGELEQKLAAVEEEYRQLKERSAHVVELSAERDRLQAEHTELTGEVERLRRQSDQVLRTGAIKWFLSGGGVLLLGWILGKTSRGKKKGFSY